MEWSDQAKTKIPSTNVETGGLLEFALTVLLFEIKASSWAAWWKEVALNLNKILYFRVLFEF